MKGQVRIKLCGLRRIEDVEAANACAPDFVGFVVNVASSRRSVTEGELQRLSCRVDAGIRRVGVFVDEPVPSVARLFEEGLIDVAQLHGHEDEAYLARLRACSEAPVIQAFRVRDDSDVAAALASSADLVLLDSGAGSGQTFDWSLVRGIPRPFLLAGGLTPLNLREAVEAVRPFGVDLSSGIETDGVKDPVKMKAAVTAVRGVL